jgi:hypothetical protein
MRKEPTGDRDVLAGVLTTGKPAMMAMAGAETGFGAESPPPSGPPFLRMQAKSR